MPDEERLSKTIISPQTLISEGIQVLDRAGTGTLLLCEPERLLVGIVTDGDIRRAILRNVPLDSPCSSIATEDPVLAPAGTSLSEALGLMDSGKSFPISQLPVVDADGRVVDLLLRSDLVIHDQLPFSAVVMAGGLGTRLLPLTEKLPKPMLPIGDRPLLERIVEQLRQAGIRRVNLTTHYLKDVISDHFGDGSDFGMDIRYIEESQPLGTAGALRLLESSNEPLLVINGDILTKVDFRSMLAFHQEQQSTMTVAVREHEFHVPYGVVETEGLLVTGITEKPTVRFFINAGIYLLDPEVSTFIPEDQSYDMPDLIARLIAEGRRVVSFPVWEYWREIGQLTEYRQASEDVKLGRIAS